MVDLYYFISDVHLGLKAADSSLIEKRFLSFLDSLPSNTKALYLLGDIFDFWYEYKYVIPRGHTRVLGRLAQLKDRGVELYFCRGNHDIWTYEYFEKEIGAKMISQPYVTEIAGKRFCLGHGDGLGYAPPGFRFMRWMFHNRFVQMLFSSLHPRWAYALGYGWSKNTRLGKTGEDGKTEYAFRGEDEPIYKYAASFQEKIDYFIFGHFHNPVEMSLPNGGKMYILGEWLNGGEYAVFDGTTMYFGNKYSEDSHS